MIAKPTIPQLLQSIKTELNDKIAPALTDPTHTVAVQMMGAILDALSIRSENEIAWMTQESAAALAAATEWVDRHPTSSAVAAALAAFRAGAADSLKLSDVQAEYDRAGELLSSLADAAYAASDTDGVRSVERLVQQRLETELAIVGSFVAVGRE